jgi:hypothetical protein
VLIAAEQRHFAVDEVFDAEIGARFFFDLRDAFEVGDAVAETSAGDQIAPE